MTQTLSSQVKERPRLRPAEPHDNEAIANLGSKTFVSCFGYSMPASDLKAYVSTAYSLASITADLSNPLMDIIVACDSADCVIGFVQLTQGTSEPCVADAEQPIELQRLYVDESYHGAGVGRALEREAERIAREKGFKTMWLGVWEDNLKAQRAYERFGFVKIGAHDFVMGECVQTDWILSKTL